MQKLGMLLVGHGTRDELGVAEFHATARIVSARIPHVAVEPCFLELAQPTIASGFEKLAQAGVTDIVVSPLLLFAAGHAQQDIPAAVHRVAAQFPHITVRFATPLECHESVLRASADRFIATFRQAALNEQNESVLLLVGRGSLDDSATAAMQEFTRQRVLLTPVRQAITCFIAMAKPSLDETLHDVQNKNNPPATVIVQPHLLFHGDLLQSIQRRVAQAATQFPNTQWLVAERLGPDPLIADALLDLFHRAAPV